MSLFQKLNKLGILSAGRRPEWKAQTDTDGAPSQFTDGVALTGAMKVLVHLPIREDAHRRVAFVHVVHDDDTTYTIDVDGDSVDVEAGHDLQETNEKILAELIGDDDISETVSADLVDDQIRLRGDGEEDWTLSVSVGDSDDGAISATIDPSGGIARVWVKPGGVNNEDRSDAWTLAHQGEFDQIDRRGFSERVTTSGYDRLYVEWEPDEPAGENVEARELTAYIGPGVME